MSPVYKKFYKEITAGFFIALATIALGYLPYDDFWQGAWVFLSTSAAAWMALKTRVKESDADRYSRLAKGYFSYWIKKDPQKVEGLFANNVPYSVVEWLKKEENCNLFDCDVPHVVDSWCRVGDEPGELIFRSGLNLGKMLSDKDNREVHEFLSEKFVELVQEKRKLLGEEIAPHVFYKELKEGDYRPTGVHISDAYSECLIIRERRDWDGATSERISLGLKKDYLEQLSDEEWDTVKNTIIYKHCPYFRPVGGGSGPQKKYVPLFLTEKKLSAEELDHFPQTATQIYNEIKKYIADQTSVNEEQEEQKQEQNEEQQ
ncbi:hypothetical protein [Candidatus Uabimicrobium amorphum]|uniref:Uncharacterized protein n=1 Tax=Uabimicrobium amorphum TaxID=2596890 RepID=A0A5S9II34_UABAM|nr:hypothetical protein [Candidatus Uabimicrobium amorphum]BBM82229.1 hypothetical protein UABAM_00572 [Candidatus Uabimicrobium amorphum]